MTLERRGAAFPSRCSAFFNILLIGDHIRARCRGTGARDAELQTDAGAWEQTFASPVSFRAIGKGARCRDAGPCMGFRPLTPSWKFGPCGSPPHWCGVAPSPFAAAGCPALAPSRHRVAPGLSGCLGRGEPPLAGASSLRLAPAGPPPRSPGLLRSPVTRIVPDDAFAIGPHVTAGCCIPVVVSVCGLRPAPHLPQRVFACRSVTLKSSAMD